jgi:hypothetical protein
LSSYIVEENLAELRSHFATAVSARASLMADLRADQVYSGCGRGWGGGGGRVAPMSTLSDLEREAVLGAQVRDLEHTLRCDLDRFLS